MTTKRATVNTIAAATALAMAAGAAQAQSVSFGPERSTTFDGGSITFDLAISPTVSGGGTLNVTYFGDMDFSGFEDLQVSVEGATIGILPAGGSQCGTDLTQTLTIPAATLSAAASDGTVSITFTDSNSQIGAFCATTASSVFSYSDSNTAFAVQGTLTISGAASTTTETEMLANRAALITASSLSTPRRINRLQNGSGLISGGLSFAGLPLLSALPADVQVTQSGGSFATGFDIGNAIIWTEGEYTRFYDDTTDDGQFAILHVGADWLVNPNVMLGVSAQIDVYDQTDSTSDEDFSGRGWMIGPVATARLTQELFLDGRLAIGRADNEIERGGTTDQFDSDRILAEVALIGQLEVGPYRLFPEAELSYFREESDAYTSATLGAVAGSEVASAQARFGGQVERPVTLLNDPNYTAFAELFTLFTDVREGSLAPGSFTSEIEGWSGEASLGLRYASPTGMTMDTSVGVGGLFTDADSLSASFNIRIPLQ